MIGRTLPSQGTGATDPRGELGARFDHVALINLTAFTPAGRWPRASPIAFARSFDHVNALVVLRGRSPESGVLASVIVGSEALAARPADSSRPLMAASATLALKAVVWFRRTRLLSLAGYSEPAVRQLVLFPRPALKGPSSVWTKGRSSQF
jgi:hypothetical protein